MFVLPYRDDNPTKKFPLFNWFLIALNVWVFFAYQFARDSSQQEAYFSTFGFIPNTFFGQVSNFSFEKSMWEWTTIFTSMFSHGGVLHLLGNMLFLYLFGDNVEDAMGRSRYLLFFLCCGTAAALTQGVSSPSSNIPMVGASGAVSGVIGSYLLVYPRANIRVFYWFFIFVGTINLPAFLLLGFWVIEQFLALPESMKGAGGVAIAAHLGGFGFGILMTPVFKKRGIPLFQKGLTRSFARKTRRFRRK